MKILALDTAQGACSAAVWCDGSILAHRYELMRVGHAELLVPMAMEVMDEAQVAMADLDRLACTIGPGTFTGTRVALSAARGMALPLKIPTVGVTTLEAVAQGIAPQTDGLRIASFDAKRGELYLQVFAGDTLEPRTEPLVLSHEEAALKVKAVCEGQEPYLAGTGSELLTAALANLDLEVQLPDVKAHPDAALVAEIAASKPASDVPPAPFYLRAPDAKLPVPK